MYVWSSMTCNKSPRPEPNHRHGDYLACAVTIWLPVGSGFGFMGPTELHNAELIRLAIHILQRDVMFLQPLTAFHLSVCTYANVTVAKEQKLHRQVTVVRYWCQNHSGSHNAVVKTKSITRYFNRGQELLVCCIIWPKYYGCLNKLP